MEKIIATKDTIEQANGFIKALTKVEKIEINFEFKELCRTIGIAKRLHRLYELQCNRSLTDTESQRVNELEIKVNDFFKKSGCQVVFNYDPRGFPVKVNHPSKVHNTWGGMGDGWGLG